MKKKITRSSNRRRSIKAKDDDKECSLASERQAPEGCAGISPFSYCLCNGMDEFADLAFFAKVHDEEHARSRQGRDAATTRSPPLPLSPPGFLQLAVKGDKCVHPCDDSPVSDVCSSLVPPQPQLPRKSSIKKNSVFDNGVDLVVPTARDYYQRESRRSKVTWADDHGEDLSEIREFEPSQRRGYLWEILMSWREKRAAAVAAVGASFSKIYDS